MSKSVFLIVLATGLFGLSVIAPKMVELRVQVFRALHMNSFAEIHERCASGITLGIRLVLVTAGLYLLALGLF